jgi:hypothetical protein
VVRHQTKCEDPKAESATQVGEYLDAFEAEILILENWRRTDVAIVIENALFGSE